MKVLLLFMALLAPRGAAAQAAAPPVRVGESSERIGSWLLLCRTDPMTDARACRMRHATWIVAPGPRQPGLALEVTRQDGRLVPTVVMRDLSLDSALNALLAVTASAQVRFGANPMLELPCGLVGRSVVCAPDDATAASASEQLAMARTMLVRVRATPPLPLDVQDDPVALDLERTAEALQKYVAAGPEAAERPFTAPDLPAIGDRLRRALGL